MKHIKITLLAVFVLSLLACNQTNSGNVADETRVLATVGDYQVTEAYLAAYLKAQSLDPKDQQQAAQGMDEIIKRLSLSHQAKQSGLSLSLEQQLLIEQARHQSLAQAAINQYLIDKPVTEEQIKAEYQRVTAELKGQEYHVHHLLYQDEVDALAVLDQLASGASYLEVEQSYLAQLPNARNVGDIGWVNIMQVPEAFRAPLQSMQAGQVHSKTILSQFGVHVLYLEDQRALVPPAFEAVKAGIQQTLEKQTIDRYQQLAVIKSKAKVLQ